MNMVCSTLADFSLFLGWAHVSCVNYYIHIIDPIYAIRHRSERLAKAVSFFFDQTKSQQEAIL